MFGAQEMQTKVYLERKKNNNVRSNTEYNVKLKLTESGCMDVKWIEYPQ
jgi:hypothetical protein